MNVGAHLRLLTWDFFCCLHIILPQHFGSLHNHSLYTLTLSTYFHNKYNMQSSHSSSSFFLRILEQNFRLLPGVHIVYFAFALFCNVQIKRRYIFFHKYFVTSSPGSISIFGFYDGLLVSLKVQQVSIYIIIMHLCGMCRVYLWHATYNLCCHLYMEA